MRRSGTALPKGGNRSLLFLGSAVLALVLLLFVVTLTRTAANEYEQAGMASAADVRLLFADANRLGFSLETPPATILADGSLAVPGLDRRTSTPGLPALPYFSTYIVLPPESNPRLTIESSRRHIETNVLLPAAPVEIVDTEPPFGDEAQAPQLEQDGITAQNFTLTNGASQPAAASPPHVNSAPGYYPPAIASISEPMMVRDVRLVRVTVYPIQYDPSRQLLSVTSDLMLVIDFERPPQPVPARLAPSYGDQHLQAIAAAVLNPQQVSGFRSLPLSLDDAGSQLPMGVPLYKIAVIADGIHELTYETLKDAGLAVDDVDPATFEMMYRGQSVATLFLGDADSVFEPGESLRFYGHIFVGSRLERQFISENVFWLWAGGQARPITTASSISGQPVTTYLASLTHEPETIYFQGFTNYWPENEPDAWYWDWWPLSQAPITRTYSVTLPNPVVTGQPAQFTAEFTGRDSHISDQSHSVAVTMNGVPNVAGHSWYGESNFNVSASVPLTAVLNGPNQFTVRAETLGTAAYLALNRITVDYQRALQATDNQLIFGDQQGGAHQYQVRGFTESEQGSYLAWDTTDPLSPTAILTASLDISGAGPYTVTYGRQSLAGASHILTTKDNLLSPASISQYVASELDPPIGADWVAISYADFVTETRRLAGHRATPSFGGLTTHVVDVNDIINQYGYGLPVPSAIRDYLAHAMVAWSVKPTYVVLVGDTTLDPRHLKADWTDLQYLPTDLVFVDRYNGQIPSDLTFALVSGADILPDLSVGRLAVSSAEELELVVNKVIQYDKNQQLSFGWMQNMVFVADQYDPSAGDFCAQSDSLASRLPPSLNSHLLCLDDYDNGGTPDAEALRTDMTAILEDTGATMLTYRGHGATNSWGGNPVIYSLAHAATLENQQPFVAVSGDCLDGHYAYPPFEGLGERLVNFWVPSDGNYGAAAHWGSSGLGISSDHTDILNGLYEGLFGAGLTAIGDAANYAKLAYYLDPYNDPALIYSFNLQGDPAMHLMRPSIRLQGAWQQFHTEAGERVTLTLTASNHGVYPAQVTLVGDPIADFAIASITSTVSHSATIAGDSARITLQFGEGWNASGIPRNGQATVTVTYDIAPDAARGPRVARFYAEATGLEIWPGNEQLVEEISVLKESIWLPVLRR